MCGSGPSVPMTQAEQQRCVAAVVVVVATILKIIVVKLVCNVKKRNCNVTANIIAPASDQPSRSLEFDLQSV